MQEQYNRETTAPLQESQEKYPAGALNFNSQNPEQENSRGFCLIQPEEVIDVNGLKLKVIKFDKKDLTLEFLSENVDEIQKGKEVKIKAGTFVVKSFGKKFAMLRTKAATTIYDQRVLDEINKQKILKMRKET